MRSQLIILIPTALMLWFLELNTWSVLEASFASEWRVPFRIIFFVIGLAPLFLAIIAEALPEPIGNIISDYFYYHLLILFYLTLVTLLLLGLGRLCNLVGISTIFQQRWTAPLSILLAFVVTGVIMCWGMYAAAYPKLTHLDIQLDKPAPFANLRIVAISDIHWETLVNHNVVHRAVNLINSRNPDIVVILGDIVTSDSTTFIAEGGATILGNIKARYGIYAVFGNHDFYDNNTQKLYEALTASGIRILRDEVLLVADSVWLVGREDIGGMRGQGTRQRMPLKDLLRQVTSKQTVIVLDHQPRDLAQNAALGIDLELSGHTHAGQLWPVSLITERIYELNYGLKKIENSYFFVTAGIGYWGPPLRLGSQAEVVEIDLHFAK